MRLVQIKEEYKEMERKISQGEIEQVIDKVKGGRTHGTDGFSGEFYKIFEVQISGRLVELFKACFGLG